MIVAQLISDRIPPVKPTDTAGKALAWMSQFGIRHLPVVDNGKLLGMIGEDDLLVASDPEVTIEKSGIALLTGSQVRMDHHIYEALKVMSLQKLDAISVIDYDETYQGLVVSRDIVAFLAEALSVHEPGGVIILKISHNSYQLSEIARICESNGAKVLSLTLNNAPDPSSMFVTLKLNLRELTRLISTFERFDYEIASVIFDTDGLDEYRENYEALLRYLRV